MTRPSSVGKRLTRSRGRPDPPRAPTVTLRVGLVGAGPWAAMSTGPMLAAGPGTTLAAMWARRPAAAAELGDRFGVPVARSFEELLGACDAVAFAVPPDVQAELAP